MKTKTGMKGLVAGAFAASMLWAAPAAASYQIAEGLTLSAKAFSDFTYAEEDATGGFHLKRTYVTLKGTRENLKFRVTLDQKAENGKVFVKYAYVDVAGPAASTVRLGQLNTPYVNWDEENFWGYRFVQDSFTQKAGLQTSADLGAGIMGQVRDGMVQYHISVLNGEGYQNPADGNGLALAGRVHVEVEDIKGGLFFHEEKKRNGTSGYNPSRWGIFAFIEQEVFRIGATYVKADDGTAGVWDSGDAINVQGHVKVPVKTREYWVFARYDALDMDALTPTSEFLVLGVSGTVGKSLTIAPNIKFEDDGVTPAINNTTIGVHAQVKL